MLGPVANDEIQGFGGFDLENMKEVVNSALDSRDEVTAAVAFVREHGDEMIDLIRRLPELMAATSEALTDASDDVSSAADVLTGGKGAGPGVKALAGSASDALDACREELGSAKDLLDAVGNAFAKLPIPDGGIGGRVTEAADRFDTVGQRLAEVADQLRKMGGAVDKAGHGLADTASKLKAGGAALGRFGS